MKPTTLFGLLLFGLVLYYLFANPQGTGAIANGLFTGLNQNWLALQGKGYGLRPPA